MTPEQRKTLLFRLTLAFIVLAAAILLWHLLNLLAAKSVVRQAPQGQASGPANAPIIIVEFMDYRCAPCRAMVPVLQQAIANHPNVRIVYRHVPADGAASVTAARLALAAGLQGKFSAMHDLLLAHDAALTDAELPALCRQAGVDYAQLERDVKTRAIALTLLHTLEAVRVLHVRTAPSFLIGNTIYNTAGGLPTAAMFDRLLNNAEAKR